MEDMMVDPVVLGMVTAGVGVVLRLADAAGEWLVLRARTRLVHAATQLPAGSRLSGSRPGGAGWSVTVPAGERG
jgi:hypothetical protein